VFHRLFLTLTPSRADRYRIIHVTHCLDYKYVMYALCVHAFLHKLITYTVNTRYDINRIVSWMYADSVGVCKHYGGTRRSYATSSWHTMSLPAFASVTASKLYADIEVIKVIVKQVQAYKQLGLNGAAAGALMQCTWTSAVCLQHHSIFSARQTCSHRQQTLQAPVSIKPMV